jgi:hypothetical protein
LIKPVHGHGCYFQLQMYYLIPLFRNFSFHWKGLQFPSLSLSLGILFYWSFCKWRCFPDFHLSLFIVLLQKGYWFLYMNFVSCYLAKRDYNV